MNVTIYEINTRVWLKRFGANNISEVPDGYWMGLKNKGIDYVWLMGIWKTCGDLVEKYCFEDGLIKSYSGALKDWKKEDVIGSPFAVDVYDVNPSLGNEQILSEFKMKLNKLGLKLILDFVPNHFSTGTSLLKTNPEIFLSVSKEVYERDTNTFFRPDESVDKYFAHGRDPFFPAWLDTVQVNFYSQQAREYHCGTLKKLTSLCDGVRCDVAMLALNNVFKNTWGGALSQKYSSGNLDEFWHTAISTLKSIRSDFIFIAETYWDLEWDLQQLGFDYTYDKKLTDKLRFGNAKAVREHLHAHIEYQSKSVRFLENHDETRALSALGKARSKAAAVIISTIPGMRFYNDGQFEGKKKRLPVQLGREPVEPPSKDIFEFYDKILSIINNNIFKVGTWENLKIEKAWEENNTFQNLLAWQWSLNDSRRIVIINYSDIVSTCRIKLNMEGYPEEIIIKDLLNDKLYTRLTEEIHHVGLYVELKPWQSHIFAF